MKFRIHAAVTAVIVTAVLSAPLHAAQLVGVDFMGMLYDLTEDGVVSNPRPTGIDTLSGIALGPDGILYGHDAATDYLWEINPATGASSPVGFLQLDVTEGDLSFNPNNGQLYGVQTFGDDRLFTIDTSTGIGTPVGTIIIDGDISAMTFDDAGNLFALDTRNDLLYRVDPTTALIQQTYSLSNTNLGPSAGMVFDPMSGYFYIADGGPMGTDRFYVYAADAQILFPLADLNLPDGLSGLAYIPEPECAILLIGGGLVLFRRRR